jgi:hypothetical protein
MNERIRELAVQAGEEAVKSVPFFRTGRCQIPSWVNVFIEVRDKKFAELIVRECIEHLEGNVAVPNLEHSRTKAKCISSIKEHFGVEEQEKVVSKPKCSVCGTTENVKYVGGHQPYLCDSDDCIPY